MNNLEYGRDSRGKIYARNLVTGVITRVWPERPWRGKSQRRQVIKARRNAK